MSKKYRIETCKRLEVAEGENMAEALRNYKGNVSDIWSIEDLAMKFHKEFTVTDTVSVKHDSGKLRYDLLPVEPIEKIVEILDYGCQKYGPNRWQNLDDFDNRYYAAAMRHLTAWRKGELKDEESKLSHLAHAACNLIFLLWHENRS